MALRKTIKKANSIANRTEADDVLKQMGILTLQIERTESDMEAQIREAKATAAEIIKPLKDQLKELEHDMDAYLRVNAADYSITRTVKLVFGSIGFHKSTGAIVFLSKWNLKKTIEAIREHASQEQQDRYLKPTYTLQKDMLNKDRGENKITDKFLAKFGLGYDKPDEPFWEPDREKIAAVIH